MSKLGRPREKDIVKTYEGKSYVVTTFRLNKRSFAEADVLRDALNLGSRTNVVQFALSQLFQNLPEMNKSFSKDEVKLMLLKKLVEYGGEL